MGWLSNRCIALLVCRNCDQFFSFFLIEICEFCFKAYKLYQSVSSGITALYFSNKQNLLLLVSAGQYISQRARDVHPMPIQSWPIVCDAGPALYRHWVNVSSLLGMIYIIRHHLDFHIEIWCLHPFMGSNTWSCSTDQLTVDRLYITLGSAHHSPLSRYYLNRGRMPFIYTWHTGPKKRWKSRSEKKTIISDRKISEFCFFSGLLKLFWSIILTNIFA